MKRSGFITGWLLFLLAPVTTSLTGNLYAAETADPDPECLACHTRSSDTPVHAIYLSPHGNLASGSRLCTACHGSSDEHRADPTAQSPSVSFGPQWHSKPSLQNQACSGCHESDTIYWIGSVHNDADVSCADCHQLHSRFEPVRDRQTQAQTCFECHRSVQSATRLQSRHPILEGKTACVDCHNPHGSASVAELVEPTLNDTCFSCHADKRGPFLFEHEPVTEDCSLCHTSHGSVNPSLLTVRGPFLCQQCHSAAYHPSQLNDGQGLPGNQPSASLLGKNCMNCHAQVHGSNHPSGARLTR